jgi:nitrite reductase (NO-forming)
VAGCGGSQPAQPPLAVTLHAQDIKFDVTTIQVTVDQPVQLTYINEGVIDHAFAIPGLVAEQKVRPGQTVVFRFTPDKVGQFKYVCVIPGHEMAGMVGTLVVGS